ncbi:MAG TPA: hypothetical protein VD999_05770 [Vitreimonas sp.]|nr:hypothetical protein [Vitreimonas sp.]
MSSRRQYLAQSELVEFANITIEDATEADDQISQAEELIDSYVGFVQPFFCGKLEGKAFAGSATSITLESVHQNAYDDNYFTYCFVEIIGGTGAGQRQKITASTKAGVLTTETFSTPPDSTSFYRIFQLGKFPREKDVTSYNRTAPTTYYKSIPEAVKRATAAQVEYKIEMGEKFFSTDSSDKTSESLGDYSYTKEGRGDQGIGNKLIAPKARNLLRGLVVRFGQFDLENTI